jgi:DNA-binding response OmpR family regulator
MLPEDRAGRWYEAWRRRRSSCLQDLAALRTSLTGESLAILELAQRLAASEDLSEHANADVEDLVDCVNALGGHAPVLLHRPVCNALTALRMAAQEVLAAQTGMSRPSVQPRLPAPHPTALGFECVIVVGEDPEMPVLVEEFVRMDGPVSRSARTLEEALEILRPLHAGTALVVVNLTLASGAGTGPHGLVVARESRRHHHAVLLVTAAADYLHYWQRLKEAGITGHDVIVKTNSNFADRLRRRISQIVSPAPLPIRYDENTGHVVWIGDIEITDLEAQETLVLLAMRNTWRTAEAVSDACWDTDLQPRPRSVPPLISTLRRKLTAALVNADSAHAQRLVIETRRRDGSPAQYRLAPWLAWVESPEPAGAARTLPPVLVIEDDRYWAEWVVECLGELGWPVSVAGTPAEARQALDDGETPILIVDLGLPDQTTGETDLRVGVRLVEEIAARRPGVRVIVLSAHGGRDSLRLRLFEAGVRTIDVLAKTVARDETRALLFASIQRAADEMRRGIRRPAETQAVHRLTRIERSRIEVDGHMVTRLSPREADVVEILISRPNIPVKAEVIEDSCYPRSGTMNKVHQTFKRLRQKIDHSVGEMGVGASVFRTPHRGARTTYELHGIVTNLVNEAECFSSRNPA